MEELRKTYWGPKFWSELRQLDPGKVCSRCKVEYDSTGFYSVSSLKKTIKLYPEEERFESEDKSLTANPDYQLLLISYLLNAQNIDPAENWVSEKDIKGGSMFFRGPHAMPAAPLERLFGNDSDGFREKSLALGGSPYKAGDLAMKFPVLPRIPFIIVLWLQDEEFPARVTFLMDSSIEAHLELDVIFSMAQSVAQKLLEG